MTKPITFDPPIVGVVVGYDGSAVAAEALLEAREVAQRRQVALHVVRAWTLSTAIGEVGAPFGTVPSYAECEAAVRAGAERAMAQAGVEGSPLHVVHAPAARTLLAAAETADVVVVGHRGGGGFGGLSLGSTAEQLVRHAPCPVLVVRPRRTD